MSGHPYLHVQDRIQHHIVAALAKEEDYRLVFKGGTMLRVCVFPDYRYSEDLDFDRVGSPRSFHHVFTEALKEATRSSGVELSSFVDRRSNLEVVWQDDSRRERMNVEPTFVSAHHIPTRYWEILRNHPDIPPAPQILEYELVTVMADKLSCISRRVAARDFYDLDSLILAGVDIHAGWALYVEQGQHPERVYGWRPHPSDIREAYLGRRHQLGTDWRNLVYEGLLPDAPFLEAFDNVDNAIGEALARWEKSLPSDELRRLKQEHDRQWGR